jgi:hypothetical protein
MKKSQNKTAQHRRLALRSEAIAVLTPPELKKVGGANEEAPCTYYSSCRPSENTIVQI